MPTAARSSSRAQASPDDLAGVGESSRASAAPRAANPGGEWTTPVPSGAPASAEPSALENLVDGLAKQEEGDLSAPTPAGLRPLDQGGRRSRRNSREMTGLDAVPETTAGVVGGDATPLAAVAPAGGRASPLAALGPSPLPAIRTGASPPKNGPVSSS